LSPGERYLFQTTGQNIKKVSARFSKVRECERESERERKRSMREQVKR
jgi:hypothetical protein